MGERANVNGTDVGNSLGAVAWVTRMASVAEAATKNRPTESRPLPKKAVANNRSTELARRIWTVR
jgi:hypothetical protein